ncbi:membrane-associating domain-containing protein [Xylogone sp. PMI_703]|nr:membrane-associating domain-containing protein [Xylogone sp. PMI_703]
MTTNNTARWIFPVRVVQAVFDIIILGLMAYIVNDWAWGTWSPSQANFMLFCSVWTILALVYLVFAPIHFPTTAHKLGIFAAEFVTMVFWFAGFIALAVLLNDVACGTRWGPCRAGIAACVFGGLEWLLFAATTIMSGLHVWRTGGARGSPKHDPNMEVRQYPGV